MEYMLTKNSVKLMSHISSNWEKITRWIAVNRPISPMQYIYTPVTADIDKHCRGSNADVRICGCADVVTNILRTRVFCGCADVRQCNLRMFIRSNIRKLPVTTSAHPHIRRSAFYPRPRINASAYHYRLSSGVSWRQPRACRAGNRCGSHHRSLVAAQ